ncbi:sortase [Candidatus Woesebacteria bacterium]|nr:sortase [Candidatus Woesebacteria bacterium]MCD8545984.1 sortase [Candidatus Woesebacteria bacterium]
MPNHTLHGSFSIQSLVSEWIAQGYSEPQVWLDLGAYRTQTRALADSWYLAQSYHLLMSEPWLQTWEIPLPRIPAIQWPSLDISFEIPHDLADRILQTSTRLAYGVSLASFLFFLGPIIILESQQAWKNIQAHLGDSRIYSAMEAQVAPTTPIPNTPTPTPEPYASAPEDVFSLRVPDLGIESVVVPNVDSSDKESYTSALKEGIAHAAGSALPDQLEDNKTVYLFAHSTDSAWNVAFYNAQFYALKDAEIGQNVTMRFWNEDYTYRIVEKKVVAADDLSYMAPQTEREQLILQTCYPPGTTWKRLLIIAVPEAEYQEYIDSQEENTASYNNSTDDMDKKLSAQYNTQTV